MPIVSLQQSSDPQYFDVSGYSARSGGADKGGLLFEWSTGEEMGIGRVNIARDRYNGDHLGMQLDPSTGQLSWVTADAKLGLYSASVKVTDRTTRSYTLVDFLIRVVAPPPKFCSFNCLIAGGTVCRQQSDCDMDACSAIVEAAGVSTSSTLALTSGRANGGDADSGGLEIARRVSFTGGAWAVKRVDEYVYRAAVPAEIGHDDARCPSSRRVCTHALVHRKRGTSRHHADPTVCESAGYCYDRTRKQCHAPACADPAHSNSSAPRIARFEAPPIGTRFDGGDYKVYLRFPAVASKDKLATNVPVTVRHAGGTSTFIVDTSAIADSQWHPLGVGTGTNEGTAAVVEGETFQFTAAVNLAFGKAAVQSSDLQGGYAGLAVNGYSDAGATAGSASASPVCTQTERTAGQWWRVDLGAVYDIEEVVLVGSNSDASAGLDVRVGTTITANDNGNENPRCGSDGSLYASGTTVSATCTQGTRGRYINVRRSSSSSSTGFESAGISLCEVRVYQRGAAAGHVSLSTAGADGTVIADAVRFQPLASSRRSQCSSDAPASVVFPAVDDGGPVATGGTLYSTIGRKISFDVEAIDTNPLDTPEMFLIGTPTPNATFVRLQQGNGQFQDDDASAALAAPESGLKMEIFKNTALSRDDQCKCDEFPPELGEPKTFYVKNINHNSFDYDLMDGLAQLGLSKASHGEHFQIRWTGKIRIPFDGKYVFSATSDDCVTVSVDGTSVMKDRSCHSPRNRQGQPVFLSRGRHDFLATFSERNGRAGVVLYWKGPGIPQPVVIPKAAFSDSVVNFETQFLGCFAAKASPAPRDTLIHNRHGICLDASQRSRRGGKVHMWTCDQGNKNQMWKYDAVTGQIKNLHGICLDASQRSSRAGKVHMWTCDTKNKNQMWTYDATSGQIKNRHGICLDASQRSRRGGKVHMWTCDTKNQNQMWRVNNVAGAAVARSSNPNGAAVARVPLSVLKKYTPYVSLGPEMRGFCAKSNGRPEPQGVILLYKGNIKSPAEKRQCARACERRPGTTACVAIWDAGNQGCYAHTRRTLVRASGGDKRSCWLARRAGSGHYSGMTLDRCQDLCRNYAYFAVTRGDQCFCDNEFARTGSTSQSCDAPCSGDPSQICGGTGKSHSVFRVNTAALRRAPRYRFEWTPQRAGGFPLVYSSQSPGEAATSRRMYIQISATNAPPENITLTQGVGRGGIGARVYENRRGDEAMQVIGFLHTVDPNEGDQHSYEIVPDSIAPRGVGISLSVQQWSNDRRGKNASTQLSQPAVVVMSTLDYESSPTISFAVRSTDGAGAAVERRFVVPVVDVNEAPSKPSLSQTSLTGFNEHLAAGTLVGTFSTSDPEATSDFAGCRFACRCPLKTPCRSEDSGGGSVNSPVCAAVANATGNCAIESLDCRDAARFRMDHLSLLTATRLDYELQAEYRLRVECQDAHGLLSPAEIFQVRVRDANDAPTSLSWAKSAGTVKENDVGASAGKVKVTDPDAADSFEFGLVDTGSDNNNDAVFTIDRDSGEVRVTDGQALDYETSALHSIVVNVTDSGAPRLSYRATLFVHVVNVVEVPIMREKNLSVAVPEDTVVGAFLTTVSASSQESTQATVTYALSDPQSHPNFRVDAASGNIFLVASLDPALVRVHTFNVVASAGASDICTVRVEVLDVPKSPVVGDVSATVPENSPSGTVVLAQIVGEDPDGPNESIEYQLIYNGDNNNNNNPDGVLAPPGRFLMDVSTGKITVGEVSGSPLDYEMREEYKLRGRATDVYGNYTDFGISLALTDINEAPEIVLFSPDRQKDVSVLQSSPSSSSSQGTPQIVYSIGESARNGTEASSDFSVRAYDQENDDFSWRIVSTEPSKFLSALAVGGSDPQHSPTLVLIQEGVLDFESHPSVVCRVEVRDTAGKASDYLWELRVRDDPERPRFDKTIAHTVYTVNENLPRGTPVGPMLLDHVFDPDDIHPGRQNNSACGPGFEDRSNAQPCAQNNTIAKCFRIDGGGCFMPEFTWRNDNPYATSGSNELRFFIQGNVAEHGAQPGFTSPPLMIHAGSGQLLTSFPFNFESRQDSVHIVTIGVRDASGLTDTIIVRVRVGDSNEHPLLEDDPERKILEGSGSGSIVLNVDDADQSALTNAVCASDEDKNDELTMTVHGIGAPLFVAEKLGASFTADGMTCWAIKFNPTDGTASLDFESASLHMVQLSVVDRSGAKHAEEHTTLVIHVVDVNEAPIFRDAERSVDITYAKSNDDIGAVIAASDPDIGDTLTYSIERTGATPETIFDGYQNLDGTFQIIILHDAERLATEKTLVAGSSILLTIKATDAKGLSVVSTVKILIVQSNRKPVLQAVNMTVAENSPPLSLVGFVPGHDPDGSALNYSVVAGNAHGVFVIDIATGGIHVAPLGTAQLDFEHGRRVFVLQVVATDGVLTASVPIHIECTDINEAPDMSDVSFVLGEHSSVDDIVGRLQANDPENDPLTYRILRGNEDSHFAVATTKIKKGAGMDSSDGFDFYAAVPTNPDGTVDSSTMTAPDAADQSFIVLSGLNFELRNHYEIVVKASDRACSCTIEANKPCFDQSTGECTAAEYDGTCSSSSSYLCGALSSTAVITVTVTDANDAPVILPGQTRSLREGAPAGTLVGGPVQVSDEDAGASFSFTLVSCLPAESADASQCPLRLSPVSGKILVNPLAGEARLDFETVSEYMLSVLVHDEMGASHVDSVRVQILDENEPPFFDGASLVQARVLPEQSPPGTPVSNEIVLASDPDIGDGSLFWAFVGKNTPSSRYFQIDSQSGAISSVASAHLLDYERKIHYYYSVQVSDSGNGGGSPLSSPTVEIKISLSDVNEPPVLTFGVKDESSTDDVVPLQLTVPEMSVNGTVLQSRLDGSGGGDGEANPDGGNAFAAAYDPENATLQYSVRVASGSIEGGESQDIPFGVTSPGGQLVVTGELDFETRSTYAFEVIISDGVLSISGDVEVTVTDANEPPILNRTFEWHVSEDETRGAFIGELPGGVELDEEQELTYSLSLLEDSVINATRGTTHGHPFDIIACNGQILLAKGGVLDYESQRTWTLLMTLRDDGTPSEVVTSVVTIHVDDVNEHPEILRTGTEFWVNEGKKSENDGNVTIGKILARDPDEGDVLTFALETTELDIVFPFIIDSKTGVIQARLSGLDYEMKESYAMSVHVEDTGKTPAGTDEVKLLVHVLDVQEKPTWDMEQRVLLVSEFAAVGTYIGSEFRANDEDNYDALSYTLVNNNDDDVPFSIGAYTGQLAVASSSASVASSMPLDFENRSSYELTLSATDSSGLTAQVSITVAVVDENDAPLLIRPVDDKPLEVSENSAVGHKIGLPFTVQDPDANQTHTFTLEQTQQVGGSASDDVPFDIDPVTGQITLASAAAIDFEGLASSTLNFVVRVTDSADGGQSKTHALPVAVTVIDVNEPPFVAPVSRVVLENAAPGTKIGEPISADDPDAADRNNLKFSIGDNDGLFSIDAVTGQLFVADSNLTMLNFERHPLIALSGLGVTVTDTQGRTATAPVSIVLQDINEAPVALPGSLAVSVEAMVGAYVGKAAICTDPDANQELTYRFIVDDETMASNAALFEMNDRSGAVSIASGASVGKTPREFELLVGIADNGDPSIEAVVSVPVSVYDTNRPPVFDDESVRELRSVQEGVLPGLLVGAPVVASDPNEGDALTFAVLSEEASGPGQNTSTTIGSSDGQMTFSINARTGQLSVRASGGDKLDHEIANAYRLMIEVRDDGFGQLRAQTAIDILVLDVNEPPTAPSVLVEEISGVTIFAVAEDADIGTRLGNLAASDPENDALRFSLLQQSQNGIFSVSSDGVLTLAGDANYEFRKDHRLSIRVDDDGSPSLGATFVVDVVVLNRNDRPTLTAGQIFNVPENALPGSLVGMPLVWDDEDIAAQLAATGAGIDRRQEKATFRIERSGCFAVSTSASGERVEIPIPETLRPTFLNVTVRTVASAGASVVSLLHADGQQFLKVTLGAGMRMSTVSNDTNSREKVRVVVEYCKSYTKTNVVCTVLGNGVTDKGTASHVYHLQLADTLFSVRRVLGGDLRPVLAESSLEDIVAVDLDSADAEPECKADGAILTLDAACDADENIWRGTVTKYNVPGFGDVQNGYCVKSNNADENSGVVKLSSKDVRTDADVAECWRLCKKHKGGEGVTGCEAIWNQGNRGCYVHTSKLITHGNGVGNHYCALYSQGGAPASVGAANTALAAIESEFSLDMQGAIYFSEEGGYYHFDNLVKRIPFVSLSPSKNPEISIEIYFRMHRYANNRGWIVSSDDRRGGYDRGISVHDHRFRNRPSGFPGFAYHSNLPQVPLGKWVHVVATFRNNQRDDRSQICMTVAGRETPTTACQKYTPRNGDGIMTGFDLGGSTSWGRHTVDADIAILRIHDRVLTKSDIEAKFREIQSVRGGGIVRLRGTATSAADAKTSSAAGVYGMHVSTGLGDTGFFEGCFGTVDADEDVPFMIDPQTGQISLREDASLNFEQRQKYGLQVRLRDSGGTSQSISVQDSSTAAAGALSISSSKGPPLETTSIVVVDVVDVNEAPVIMPRCTNDQALITLRESVVSLRPLASSLAVTAANKKSAGLYYLVAAATAAAADSHLILGMGHPNSNARSTTSPRKFSEGASFRMIPGLWDATGVTFAEYTTTTAAATTGTRYLCRKSDGSVRLESTPRRMSKTEVGRKYMRDCTWVMENGLDASTVVAENDFASIHNIKSFKSIELDEDAVVTYLSVGRSSDTLNGAVTWNANDASTEMMRAQATFFVESPVVSPLAYRVTTRAWMWSIGTSSLETRKCSLTWEENNLLAASSLVLDRRKQEYLAKWSCGSERGTGVVQDIYVRGDRLFTSLSGSTSKECVLDMKSDQPGSPEGLDTELEFAAVWRCDAAAMGAPLTLLNGRVYTPHPTTSGKRCALLWHADFGVLSTYLEEGETVAKWNCDGSSAHHVDLELASTVGTQADHVGNAGGGQMNRAVVNSFAACEAVMEHAPSGTKVGEPLFAIDPDVGQDVTFSIASAPFNAEQIFAIDADTGQIVVKSGNAPALLDFESKTTARSIILTIAATDSNMPPKRTMRDVLVTIQDVNEEPAMPQTAVFDIREDAAPGTKLSFSLEDNKRNAQSIASARNEGSGGDGMPQDAQEYRSLKPSSSTIRSVQAISWSSHRSKRQSAAFAVDGSARTSWLVPEDTFAHEHWVWVDLRKRYDVDKIRMKIFNGNSMVTAGSMRVRLHVAPSNQALQTRENWWGALDRKNKWTMAAKNHAVTSLWRNHGKCTRVYCIEEATSALGVDHGKCVDVPWKTNGEQSACANGYYVSGFRTLGTHSTGAFDQIRCCPDLNEKRPLALEWKSCFEADWSLSFSERGSSGCNDPKHTLGQDGIFKLAGLTATCADNIKCISKAKCCRSPHAAADPVSIPGATSLEIDLKNTGDSWNSFNNIEGMNRARLIRVSVSLDDTAVASKDGQTSWVRMPEIEFFGTESSTVSAGSTSSAGTSAAAAGNDDTPWEPLILWETGQYHYKIRPRSAAEIIEAVDASDFSARGYCSTFLSAVSLKKNRQCPSGSNRDIAFRVTMRFSLRKMTKMSFRFGADFGVGSVVLLDGNVIKSHTGDLWWGGRWSHPHVAALAVSDAQLERGNHELVVYGLERCCDGSQTYQFKIEDEEDPEYSGKWQDISAVNLLSYAGSTLPGADGDPGANGRLSYRLGSKTVAPFVCADREGTTCKGCTGTVFYGKKYLRGRPGSGKTTTLAQLKMQDHATLVTSGADVSCSNGALGDPLRGIYKYCYCDPGAAEAEVARRLPFVVDSISGQVMLAEDISILDFETAQQHTFSVTAIDGGGMEASTQVTVNVLDVNEPPSFEASKATFSVLEGSIPGTKIGQVTATDPDVDQSLSYPHCAYW